ncbi:MAG: hypothetical protein M1838_001075 [Thelocarpon superellum]|nr:MAG: hypothetical protein M1838_001075 [Thelocarpon superellum]
MTTTKKTVLITGCSPGGIGHALCREFHSKGLRVFATARSKDVLADLAGAGMETLSLDVNSAESVREVKAAVETLTGGKLDVLVNNAGRNYTVPALDLDFDEVQNTFETNVFGVMRMCQAFAPLLIQAKGTILQIGSVAAYMPFIFGATYNATKAALHAYSTTMRLELAPFGVKVMVMVTGGVQSRIARTDRNLPADSLYHPVNTEYQRRIKFSQEGAMPAETYARDVVRKVLRTSPPVLSWGGGKIWLVYFLNLLFPITIWDYIFPRIFGMNRLAALVKASEKNAKKGV